MITTEWIKSEVYPHTVFRQIRYDDELRTVRTQAIEDRTIESRPRLSNNLGWNLTQYVNNIKNGAGTKEGWVICDSLEQAKDQADVWRNQDYD